MGGCQSKHNKDNKDSKEQKTQSPFYVELQKTLEQRNKISQSKIENKSPKEEKTKKYTNERLI